MRDNQNRIVKWFGTCTDIDVQKRTENASRFLAQAGAVLAAQLDEHAIIQKLTELCVPSLADWCFVDFTEGAEAPVWEQKALDPLLGTPVLYQGFLYGPSQSQKAVVCLNAKTGAVQWISEPLAAYSSTAEATR